MLEEFKAWLNVPGIQGLLFQRGAEVVESHFPPVYSSHSVQALCDANTNMLTAYRQAGRALSETLLTYVEGTLLILAAPPPEQENSHVPTSRFTSPVLTILAASPDAAELIMGPANAFLLRQSKINLNAWKTFTQDLNTILAKVISRSQTDKLIARVLAVHAPGSLDGIPRDQFRSFAEAVVRAVPNRSKHDSLLSAVDLAISKLPPL
jgi:hypothetical protein